MNLQAASLPWVPLHRVTSLDEQMAYQRAFEATVWSMPALGIYGVRNGVLTATPMKENDIGAFSAPAMCVLRGT